MAYLIQLLTDVGDSSPAQEMYLFTRRASEFVRDALMPIGYPRRVFNNFSSRDISGSTVTDGVGELNGHILVCRCPWRFEHIKYPPLRPLYKEKTRADSLIPESLRFLPEFTFSLWLYLIR